MGETAAILGFVNIALGLLIIGLAVPLLLAKIPRNSWYGVRLPESFTSESNWYRLNRYGAIQMMWYGAAIIVLGLVALFSPPRPGSAWFFSVLAAPGLLMIPVLVMVLRFAKRLPR